MDRWPSSSRTTDRCRRRAIEITTKLAGALEAAHRAGVLHRDVKPESVFVSAYGEPKLGDFGMARLQAGLDAGPAAGIAHAAPEIVDGRPPTEASDVYSLASSAFAFLTGHAPFVRDTDQSVVPLIARIATEPVPVAELRTHGVSDAVGRVLADAMAKDPAQRTASAAAFASELQRAAADGSAPALALEPIIASPSPSTSTSTEIATAPSRSPARQAAPAGTRSRRPLLIGLGVVVVAALVGGGIAIAGGGGDSKKSAASSASKSSTPSGSIENVPLPQQRTPEAGKLAVDVNVGGLNKNECWNDPGGLLNNKLTAIPGVDVVRCTTPHDLEVYAAIQVAGDPGSAYPGDDALNSFATSNCASEFSSFVGRDEQASDLTYYYTYPSSPAGPPTTVR